MGWLKMRLQFHTLQLSSSWSLLFNATFLLSWKKLGTSQAFRNFSACVHVDYLTAVAWVQLPTTTCCLAVRDRPWMWQGALWPCGSRTLWCSKSRIYLGGYSNRQACPICNAGIQEYGFIPWCAQKWTDTLLVYASGSCGWKAGLDLWQSQIYVWKAMEMGLKRWCGSCSSIKAHVPSLLSQRSSYGRMAESPAEVMSLLILLWW